MNDEPDPDPAMTEEQEAIAASLSTEFIAKIDKALLSHARVLDRKVAMLVGLTMMDDSLRAPGLPDLFYAQRVKRLVKQGALVARGYLGYMRYSEVRLP
jgi:hypothetical protein